MTEPSSIYVIYSADILGASAEIDSMGPFRSPTREYPYAAPLAGAWAQTEGDEQYDYGYLADESGDPTFYPAGAVDREGTEPIDNDEPVGEGRHRKWVAELTLDEWHAVADALCIDLGDDGVPEQYEDTMGSITEYGHIPAVCVDNTEGWTPTRVISSQLYVSFAS